MTSPRLRSRRIYSRQDNSSVGGDGEIGASVGVNLERIYQRSRFNRRGAAAVEFALVAPLFFLVVLGMVEIGRAVMVMQVVTNAAREGARLAVIDGSAATPTTTTVVQNWVKSYLSNSGLSSSAATVTVSPEPSTATDGTQITVTVSIPYSAVSWLPTARFMAGRSLKAKVVMRRETVQ